MTLNVKKTKAMKVSKNGRKIAALKEYHMACCGGAAAPEAGVAGPHGAPAELWLCAARHLLHPRLLGEGRHRHLTHQILCHRGASFALSARRNTYLSLFIVCRRQIYKVCFIYFFNSAQ